MSRQNLKKHNNPSTSVQELSTLNVTVSKYMHPIIMSVLVVITGFIFFPSLFNGFVLNWDDATYIHENYAIQSLSWANIKTIFTSYHNGNYHPLTELSYAIEYHFVQINPFLYHLDNLIIHIINVSLMMLSMMDLHGARIDMWF